MATQTTNYGLTIFEPDDKPTWQGDWNENMTKIDTAIHDAAQGGGGGGSVEIAQTTGTSTTAVMSQNATTEALNDKVNTSAVVQEINTATPSNTNIPSEAAVAAVLGSEGKVLTFSSTTVSTPSTTSTDFLTENVEAGNYIILGMINKTFETSSTGGRLEISVNPNTSGSVTPASVGYNANSTDTGSSFSFILLANCSDGILHIRSRRNGGTAATITGYNIIAIKQ